MRKLVRLQQHRDAFAAEGSSSSGSPGPSIKLYNYVFIHPPID